MGIVAVDEKLAADGEQLGASRLIVPKKPPVRAIDPFSFEGAVRALRIRILSSRMTATRLDNDSADTYEERC